MIEKIEIMGKNEGVYFVEINFYGFLVSQEGEVSGGVREIFDL